MISEKRWNGMENTQLFDLNSVGNVSTHASFKITFHNNNQHDIFVHGVRNIV